MAAAGPGPAVVWSAVDPPSVDAYLPMALVVDDDPIWLDWMLFHLRHSGWNAIVADSGESALPILGSVIPDLIVVDRFMPGMSGLELAQAVRKSGYGGPMLLLSALEDQSTRRACSRVDMQSLSKLAHADIFRTLETLRLQSVAAHAPVIDLREPAGGTQTGAQTGGGRTGAGRTGAGRRRSRIGAAVGKVRHH